MTPIVNPLSPRSAPDAYVHSRARVGPHIEAGGVLVRNRQSQARNLAKQNPPHILQGGWPQN
jgi:hypothetical protein